MSPVSAGLYLYCEGRKIKTPAFARADLLIRFGNLTDITSVFPQNSNHSSLQLH